MILVDTSVWIDHIRSAEPKLFDLLQRDVVMTHPAVIGEIALGRSKREEEIISSMSKLARAEVADDDEVLIFIRRNALAGSGIGYADAHILSSVRLTPGVTLWTRDRRLKAVAQRLGLDADIEPYRGMQED